MATRQFKLPDVGEGLTEGEILQWLVAVGDTVTVNQPLCEVETAKAAVELPSPYAGTVTELLFDAGTMVDVGAPIITIDVGGAATAEPQPAVPAAAPAAGADEPAAGLIGGAAPGGRTAVLVGYGPRNTEARRRPRRGGETVAARATAPQTVLPEADYGSGTDRPPLLATAPDAAVKPVRHGGLEVGRQAEAHALAGDAAPSSGVEHGHRRPRPLAKPPVRKYAKDLGVDLTTVQGTGNGGVITRADVDAAKNGATATVLSPAFGTQSVERVGGEQRIPIKGVRKHTAAAMVASAFTAPHVTEFLTVDVTRMMKLRQRLALRPELAGVKVSPLLFVAQALLLAVRRHPMINSSWDDAAQEIVVKDYVNLGIAAATPRGLVVPNIKDAGRMSLAELAGVKVSPLLFVAQALLLAVRRHPMINSSWDEANQEIVVKDYVNLGIAAATPRGLVVPNIKDAGRMSLAELAGALAQLTATAREGKTAPADMSGGTITITNVGVFGVDTGTPILNPGESAILAFGAVREQPWVHKGKIRVRQVTQLALSFDHRIVDGELGSRFLADVGAILHDPGAALAF